MKDLRQKINVNFLNPHTAETLNSFHKLIAYIDAAFGQAYKLEGDNRSQFLVTSILSIRDYLSNEMITSAVKNSLQNKTLSSFDAYFSENVQLNENNVEVPTSPTKKNLNQEKELVNVQ